MDVETWILSNCLGLNPDKTKFMLYSTICRHVDCRLRWSVCDEAVHHGNQPSYLHPQPSRPELHRVIACWEAREFLLYSPRRDQLIRRSITRDTAKTLVNSRITSQADVRLNRVPSVHNAAVRVITGTRKCDHITPRLLELRRLPVPQRENYKLYLTVHASFGSHRKSCTKQCCTICLRSCYPFTARPTALAAHP